MAPSFRLALMGCGRAAESIYLPALARLPEMELVAVCDPLVERREQIAAVLPGCRPFTSPKTLLEEVKVDGVVIATPPATHVELACLALRAGVPVMVEKPLATSLEEAARLEAVAALSRSALMVGFNRRQWEPVLRLREILRRREPSRSASARTVFTVNTQAAMPVTGLADVLDDLGSHHLDLLRYVFRDEIAALRARRADERAVDIELEMRSGVRALCQLAHGCIARESIDVECGAQRYRIQLGSERLQPAGGPLRALLDLAEPFRRRLLRRPSSLRRSYDRQLAQFRHCVRSGQPPQPGLSEGIEAVRLVEAARRSLQNNGQEVTL